MRIIKSKKGFTLVEMLVCVLTLLLVGGICATGTGISIKNFQQSRYETDSQMLQSTLDMVFSDMFRYATYVTTDGEGNVISFKNVNYNKGNNEMVIEIPDSGEHMNRFVVTVGALAPLPLIGDITYAENLYVSDFVLKYDSTKRVFKGSYTIKSTIINDVGKNCNFTYRGIATQLN